MTQLANLIKEWKYKNGRYVCELHGAGSTWNGSCGYVGVPKGHPIWGLHYDEVMKKIPSINKRLQLTYSTEDKDPEDGLWLVGFHTSDINDLKRDEDGVYQIDDCGNFPDPGKRYVIKMVEWLAKQLEKAEDVIEVDKK